MFHTNFLETFRPDLAVFRERTMAFHRKEVSVAEYKGFSGGFGSYAQRGGEKHMLRLRMAGGRLTKDKLAFIADAIGRGIVPRLKLTTCQTIQMHDLEAEDLCELIEQAWDAGMISRGGGGDFPRNVMCTPRSGLTEEETFDVLPYAEITGQYLMNFIHGPKFPRKLKVCFSNTLENEPHATFRDLGFVANQNHTFDVYAAGGLGVKPALGVKVASQVKPEDILYYAKAMVTTFLAHGNYENRGKARTRFMQESLGADGFVSAFLEALEKSKAEDDLSFVVPEISFTKTSDVSLEAAGLTGREARLYPQKQRGLYSVFYQPAGGLLAPSKLVDIYNLIKGFDEVELRITPSEGLYIVNLSAEEAKQCLELTSDSASTLFDTSVACIGSSTCQVGIGDSQSLLSACLEEVAKESFADGVLPKIHISGCPSSCSAHQTAAIGFRGAVRQSPEGPKKAFALFVNGNAYQGQEVISEAGPVLLVEEIPCFLIDLGRLVTASNTTYEEWIKEHQADFDELVKKYA